MQCMDTNTNPKIAQLKLRRFVKTSGLITIVNIKQYHHLLAQCLKINPNNSQAFFKIRFIENFFDKT